MPLQSKLSYSTKELVDASKKHVACLQGLYKLGIITTSPSLHSLVRYKSFWLPLVAKCSEGKELPPSLIPPPDIAWLWHCHRLAPSYYEAYVKATFGGKLIEATTPFAFQDAEDEHDSTQQAWKEAYPEDPFFLTDSDADPSQDQAPETFPVGKHDLVASVKSQATFLWQVSTPQFRDDAFLEQGVQRYLRFLSITDHSLPLVPTFQIDLMWHTHMLLSIERYNQDCISIRGDVFHHDDSLNDRNPGSVLDRAFGATGELYQEKYSELYHVDGGMYRGEPPASFWDTTWKPNCALDDDDAAAAALLQALELVGATGATSAGKKPGIPAAPSTYFILASAPSTYPIRSGYVFGQGALGLGYYSLIETSPYIQEAYKILLQRLSKRAQADQHDMGCMLCMSCHCFGGKLSPEKQTRYDATGEHLRILETMIGNVKLAMAQKGSPPDATFMGSKGLTGSPWYTNYGVAASCGGVVHPPSSSGGGGGCGGCGGCGG